MIKFYVIQVWMINELGLKGVQKDVYAIVYGFSQDGESRFSGSINRLCEAVGAGRTAVSEALKKLVEDRLIIKHDREINGCYMPEYSANPEFVAKKKNEHPNRNVGTPYPESVQHPNRNVGTPYPESGYNNNYLNTIDNKEDNKGINVGEVPTHTQKSVKGKIEDPAAIEVIEYLNELAGTKYFSAGPRGEKNRQLASRLLKEFSSEDVRAMIEMKVFEWKNDAKMAQYLRPATLFGLEKGLGYMQQLYTIRENPKMMAALKKTATTDSGGRMKGQSSVSDAMREMMDQY